MTSKPYERRKLFVPSPPLKSDTGIPVARDTIFFAGYSRELYRIAYLWARLSSHPCQSWVSRRFRSNSAIAALSFSGVVSGTILFRNVFLTIGDPVATERKL